MIIDGKRALAYITTVTNIAPIEGADNIELGHVEGWPIICKKGEFAEGDKCVYFEIDSKLPASDERFAFMVKKDWKVKTYKLNKFKVIGQGLALPLSDFPELAELDLNTDVTEKLGVTYYMAEDNSRKALSGVWESVKSRHPKLAKNPLIKWLAKHQWGRTLITKVCGHISGVKGFPTKFPHVKKSDQERCENMPWVLKEDDASYIRTQKCDGSSGTYILERKPLGRYEFYVCSRNIRQLRESQECFYNENFYWQMAKKYNIEKVLKDILKEHKDWKYVCVQGEVCGPKIQGNPHGLKEYHLYIFHFIDSVKGKWDVREMRDYLVGKGLECVPIEDIPVSVKMSMEDFKATAVYNYDPACCEGKTNQLAEGYVYYKVGDPNFSFKNVSRDYLLKHN